MHNMYAYGETRTDWANSFRRWLPHISTLCVYVVNKVLIAFKDQNELQTLHVMRNVDGGGHKLAEREEVRVQ